MIQQAEEEIYAEALRKILTYIDEDGSNVNKIFAYAIDALHESRK